MVRWPDVIARGLAALAVAALMVVAPGCVSASIEGYAAPDDDQAAIDAPDQDYVAPEPIGPAPSGFSWLIDDTIGGMGYPGWGSGVENALEWLAGSQVGMLVSLTQSPISAELVMEYGMMPLHVPIKDFTAPSIAQIQTFVAEVDAMIDAGESVAVHCGAGLGRTGTMLAAWLISHGYSASAAINEVRDARPGSIETMSQIDVLYDYAAVVAGATQAN